MLIFAITPTLFGSASDIELLRAIRKSARDGRELTSSQKSIAGKNKYSGGHFVNTLKQINDENKEPKPDQKPGGDGSNSTGDTTKTGEVKPGGAGDGSPSDASKVGEAKPSDASAASASPQAASSPTSPSNSQYTSPSAIPTKSTYSNPSNESSSGKGINSGSSSTSGSRGSGSINKNPRVCFEFD